MTSRHSDFPQPRGHFYHGPLSHAGTKNLPLIHASVRRLLTSPGETPLIGSFAEEEILDPDLNPHAPKTARTHRIQIINTLNRDQIHPMKRTLYLDSEKHFPTFGPPLPAPLHHLRNRQKQLAPC